MSDNEWYTPQKYIEAAREVMGSIDLDPASCALANETVKADTYYTKENNGLELPWYGNVWLNPPYSNEQSIPGMSGGKLKGSTGLFIDTLLDYFIAQEVEQAIVCLNADTCRTWFQALWDYSICFSNKPIQFIRPGKKPEHHFFPTAFVYLGKQEKKFQAIFSQFGTIVKKVA